MTRYFFVVVPHHGNVLWNFKTGFFQSLIATNRHTVILAKDGSWPIAERQQLLGPVMPRTGGPIPVYDQTFLKRKICFS